MPKHYSTTFTKTINNITKHFLQAIINADSPQSSQPLPEHAWYIATTPPGLGGLGFHDIEAKAIRMFTATLAQSIRSTKFGLKPQAINVKSSLLQDILIHLPTHITSTFKSWKTSSLHVFEKNQTSTSKEYPYQINKSNNH